MINSVDHRRSDLPGLALLDADRGYHAHTAEPLRLMAVLPKCNILLTRWTTTTYSSWVSGGFN